MEDKPIYNTVAPLVKDLPAGHNMDTTVALYLSLPLAAYSTDIAAAWPLLLGKKWILYESEPGEWVVFDGWRDAEDWIPLATAETAPLAICRAAILYAVLS